MGHQGQHGGRRGDADKAKAGGKRRLHLKWSGRRAVQGLVALVVAVVPFVVTMPSAFAGGVGFGVTPSLTASGTATVGQTGVPGVIQVANTSFGTPEDTENVTINSLFLVPSCGTTAFVGNGDCPAAEADPGVFQLGATGTGEASTACAGQTFIITVVDPSTGQVSFTPTTGTIVLTPPGSGDTSVCRIDFLFNVLKAPTKSAGPSAPNTVETAQIGYATGTAATSGATGTGSGSGFVTVLLAAPSVTTTATATGKAGAPITDTATLAPASPPGPAPTGTITFNLYFNDAACTSVPVFTSVVTVNSGTGSYTSAAFTPTTPGTYRWVAAYSGDANDAPTTTACGDPGETSTISQATPTIVTTASAAVSLGGTISDSAVLAGGLAPTGTITFSAYGPADPTCTGTAAFTSVTTVTGNGTYSSAVFTPTASGSYNFVAAYSGDTDNAAVTSACGSAGETSTVNKLTPTIVTTASAQVMVGGTISDSAVLAGGSTTPTITGTITFDVFGPANPTCTGTPAFMSVATVSGNGTYTSSAFTTTLAGTYQFVASYSGDANNVAVTSACGAPNESVVVAKTTPMISTTASPTVAAGNPISDSATLSGGVNATGTITFTLFGPGNPTCSGTAIFMSVSTVTGNGVYPSGAFTTTAPGVYNWVAVYSGDANNSSVTSGCGAANESVTVTQALPTIVTVASSTVVAGGQITDTATLAGGSAPTGTITFTVFGPNNPTCTNPPVFTSPVTVTGNGNYTSAAFTTPAAGTYNFIASYGGDTNNKAVTTSCGDPNESVTVTKAPPAIVTLASSPVAAGGAINDTATLSGGVNPTGTITFTLFGPNNATCTGTPIFTSAVPVTSGNGNYTSGSFTTVAAGTYQFIASYGGDASNLAATSSCGAANESVVVGKATPAIVTHAGATVTVGGSISDTATLSGGVGPAGPTGTITFNVYGPNDATCSNAPAFVAIVSVTSGNGTYASGPFVSTAAGTYRFIAAYSGDVNNAAVTTLCNDPNESVVVNTATPALVTTASTSVPVGGTISDTATLSGGVGPTGTITFDLFGPNNATCTGTAIFTSTVTVTGNGNYTSASFTTAAPGTYSFEASYSGDTNNAPIALTACGAAGENVTVTKGTPAIVTTASASVPAGGAVSDTATLSGGTAPTGTITFTLFGPNNATCTGTPIFTSVKTVTGDGNYTSDAFTTAAAGTYEFEASYSGDANNVAVVSGCGAANESVVVIPAVPAIVTHASASVAAGGMIADTATLSGGASPTGTITFTLFGPNNATCTGAAIFTSTVAVTGNGNYTSTPSFTANLVGTYQFVAVYSGDGNNTSATSACGAANESVVVTKTAPAIVTVASAPVPVGGSITDTATLSGGVNPTGTITFTVYGPNDATCSMTPAFTSTKSVTANGAYTSDPFTVTLAGTYRFIAAYSGDANNAAATTACNDPNESVVVGTTTPAIVTAASGTVHAGGTIGDTATLSGGVNPTGTITFDLFGPNNATCTGTAIFTSTATVTGNGSYPSAMFTTVAAGTYRWTAAYSGDTNNGAVTSGCNAANENVVVTVAAPALATQASAPVTVGGTISDTASLSGGTGPTGTITFDVFGPNNATCSGTAAFTSTVPVAGNGTYPSGPFTVTAPGTYRFVATYSGDANNAAAGPTSCSDPAESVVVSLANVTIVTHASSPVTVGGTVTDTATLAGGVSPTGTITFDVFGPNNATCTGIPAFTSVQTVNGNGNYTSSAFTVPAVGSYRFVATYSGDANNSPAGPTSCSDANEVSSGTPATPALVTTVSGAVAVGGAINDTATLSGGFNPTGTITFDLFGPNNATCTGTPAFTSTVTVNGTGNYTSASFTTTAPGTYSFVASYSGDTNNVAVGPTACGVPAETVTVAPVASSLSTTASPSVDVGQAVSDTATLGGSGVPTGTITFELFGPNDSTCTGTPAFTSTVTVNGTGTYPSGSFIPTAAGTYEFVATYSGDANTAPAGPTPCNDPAEAVVVLPTPQIAVTKAASPLTRPEPGGNFTFTVTVSNPSTVDPVKITSLFDNIYGDLSTRPGSTCGSLIGVTLAPGATSPPCTFTGPFTGMAPASQTDTVTVTGVDTHGVMVSATAQATVTLTPVTPQISVTKAASPLSLPEPGGTFTFTVQVTNPSTIDPITITTLVDNIYGNLATRAGSTCAALIGTTLAPGASSAPCTFTGPFNGTAPASQTDTVTVTGMDANGNTATATAQATVTLTSLTPVIAVTKAASPLSLPEPGGTFTFTVQVSNPSATDPVKITTLVDNIYGNLATRSGSTCGALIGTTLAPGGVSAPCTFTGPFNGTAPASQTDTVTVTGVDSFGNTATATAQATVTLTTVTPEIAVTKAASPSSLAAPGGTFTFTVTVSNPSTTDPVKITSLVDNIYGNLATLAGSTCGALIGTTLAPGATSAPCTFQGPFMGVSGASQTDTVTVTGVDTLGTTVTATAQATVTLTPSATPVIAVTKTANPTTLPAPGGPFIFTVTVSNPSATVPVEITSLVDNIYGDLATLPGSTCGTLIGTTLQPGASAPPCTFKGTFTGVSGASQTDTVTVTGVNPNNPTGPTVSATAMATVTLTPAPAPVIGVTKSANPLSLPQPGGTFTFTVTVTNPSATVPVTITSLVDNIYGNLATRPGSTCGALIGTTLAPGATSPPCSFTGTFTGAAGATQTDIVTASGVNPNNPTGTPVTATAQATVGITALPVSPPLALTGLDDRGPLALAGAMLLGGLLLLAACWRRRRVD